jgi:hypothetical protein
MQSNGDGGGQVPIPGGRSFREVTGDKTNVTV